MSLSKCHQNHHLLLLRVRRCQTQVLYYNAELVVLVVQNYVSGWGSNNWEVELCLF